MIQLDYNAIPLIDWMQFIDNIRNARIAAGIKHIDKYIVGWDYDIPITKGFRGIPNVIEFNKCLRQVMDYVEERVNELKVEDVEVDLSQWSFDTYETWENARFKNNWPVVVKMLHEVASYDDSSPEEKLNGISGLLMVNAVVEVYQKSFLEPN